MSDDHEQFISKDDQELNRIRDRKLKELMESKTKKQETDTEPVHVTDSTFNNVVCANKLALIDFWADWCGPCRALAPTIKELAKEYSGKVFVGKLNVDENPETAECFQVYSIPTMLIMRDGKEVDRIVGCVPKTEIETTLKKHMG